MKELRFARSIYSGEAIDAAIAAFADFAGFERAEEAGYWVVRMRALRPEHARRVAGEFGNYCLGLTLERDDSTPEAKP